MVLENLGMIENGVSHTEIFLNQNGELICLEVAARPPGLVAEHLYEKHLNLSINRLHFELQLGCYHGDLSNLKIENYAARYIFPFPSSGRIVRFANKKHLHSEVQEAFQCKVGDVVKRSADLFNVASTMVLSTQASYFKTMLWLNDGAFFATAFFLFRWFFAQRLFDFGTEFFLFHHFGFFVFRAQLLNHPAF